ncbi:MAG: GGDEF domain-containing protein [Acidimicrobiia bacterium]|nr:GGDEF domain-containing protein [Acidimicrobiia bacterium]
MTASRTGLWKPWLKRRLSRRTTQQTPVRIEVPDAAGTVSAQLDGDRALSLHERALKPRDLGPLASSIRRSAEESSRADRSLLLLLGNGSFHTADDSVAGKVADIPPLAVARATATTHRSDPVTATETRLFGPRAEVAWYFPIVYGGTVVGVIAVAWNDRRRARRADPRPLHQLAHTSALPLLTSLLFTQARDAEHDALRLVDAVSALSATHTSEEVANVACLHARKLARARMVRLIERDPSGNHAVLSSNPGSNHPSNRSLRLSSALLQAIEEGDVCLDESPHRRSLFVPVRADGEVVAVLQFDFPATSTGPSERMLRLCGAVATQTGVALERARRTDELQRLAITDSLTGLANRRQVLRDLQRETSRGIRTGEAVSIAMIDLDHFKAFNDHHGHVEGDRELRAFGHFLDASVRAMDSVGRYGGEEFLLVLPRAPLADAFSAVDRLRREWLDESNVSFSAGVAALREGETFTDLVIRADTALYRAKRAGRNRVETDDGKIVSLSTLEPSSTTPKIPS